MNPSGSAAHWERVYSEKGEQCTSWYSEHLEVSLRLVDGLALAPDDAVIDVGGGRSTFVDDLLARGQRAVTVLDIASESLAQARARLGAAAAGVRWIVGDVTTVELPPALHALWHDRAVFHFLVDAADRARYASAMACSVRAGGHAIVAAFAPDGPERCSELPVHRYDADALAAEFAPAFAPVARVDALHRTPWGGEQPFTHVLLRRAGAGETQDIRC